MIVAVERTGKLLTDSATAEIREEDSLIVAGTVVEEFGE